MIGDIEKIRPYLSAALARAGVTPDNIDRIIGWCAEADPAARASRGRKTPWTSQIMEWFISGAIRLPEDVEDIHRTLKTYSQLLGQHPDFRQYRGRKFAHPSDILKLIEPYLEKKAVKYEKFDFLPAVAKQGQYTAYEVTTFEQAQRVVGDVDEDGAHWCIGQEDYWDEYSQRLPLYFISKGNRRFALLHVPSQQLHGTRNEELRASGDVARLCAALCHRVLQEGSATPDEVLAFAVRNDLPGAIKYALDAGADVNAKDGKALRHAATNNSIDMVKLLLDAGADVNAKSGRALAWAAENNHLEMVRLLLDAGADVKLLEPQYRDKLKQWGLI